MNIVGARGLAKPPEDRLSVVRAWRERGTDAQLLDARVVLGRDHLVSAVEHADRAMREGRNAARTLAVEFVLYAAGRRQIADALEAVGIREDAENFAVVWFGEGETDTLLAELDLVRDDAVLAPSVEKLRRFGVTEREIATVPPERAADLVLERVALVDVLK